MSVVRLPEGMNSIWDNEVFDNGESEDSSIIMKSSWPLSEKSLDLSPHDSVNSFSDKENNNLLENSSNSVVVKSHSSSMPLAALNSNGVLLENSRIKTVPKLGFVEKSNCKRDEKNIDREMEEIEREISRLSSRLEALRIEKSVAVAKKRGIDAKILEGKKMVEGGLSSARTMMQRRRLSLCPQEMISTKKRGLSLGPAEIMKSGHLGKQQERMVTPVQANQSSRRKSCFWKLQDIGEEMSKERGKTSLSLSPRSRKCKITNLPLRQVATTVASKKTVKKEDGIGNSIQPKKLFKDGEKSVTTSKKAPRPGRVIASRYNQNTAQVQALAVRKRSLPEDENDGSKRCDKKRSISPRVTLAESNSLATEIRVKKRWEIPSELIVHTSSEADNSPLSIVVPDLLPRIKTSRCINETPRDSGQAKRVIDLIGRKSYFSIDEEYEPAVCQTLSFPEENEKTD